MRTNANFGVFKEPRGFIKILEIGIAVFAFATTAGYFSEFKVQSSLRSSKNCSNVTVVVTNGVVFEILGKFEYPFDDLVHYISPTGNSKCKIPGNGSNVEYFNLKTRYKSESQFFVFTGVATFLFCFVACMYYVLFENQEENMYSTDVGKCSFVVIDFVVSVVLVIFWFISSAAWASGLPSLEDDTDPKVVFKSLVCAGEYKCDTTKEPNYATLRVSVILGFLNLFVWLGNLWFLFKETPWHNPRREQIISEPSVQ